MFDESPDGGAEAAAVPAGRPEVPTDQESATGPEPGPDPDPDTASETQPAAPTRRERRARHGGESAAGAGRAGGARYPVPAKRRNYAARRRG